MRNLHAFKLVIVLLIKNIYNKEIHRRVAGAKNINTLLVAFKSTLMNLLKLKKYEGLVSDDEHRHTVHTVNQITSKGLDMIKDKSLTQTDSYRQKYVPSTNSYSKQVSSELQQTQMSGNPYQQLQPHFTPCYTCALYRHLSKNCLQQPFAQQNKEHNTSSHTTISKQTKYCTISIFSSYSSKQFPKVYTAT